MNPSKSILNIQFCSLRYCYVAFNVLGFHEVLDWPPWSGVYGLRLALTAVSSNPMLKG